MRIKATLTDPEIMAELGHRLRAYRQRAGHTIGLLAAEAGLSPLTLSKAEQGKNMTVTTLLRLLRALRQIEALDAILPEEGAVSPLALLEAQRAETKRGHRPRG